MIEIGSLVASTKIEIVDAVAEDLSSAVSLCVGDRIFDAVPVSISLQDGHYGDPSFSVNSIVLTADLLH